MVFKDIILQQEVTQNKEFYGLEKFNDLVVLKEIVNDL